MTTPAELVDGEHQLPMTISSLPAPIDVEQSFQDLERLKAFIKRVLVEGSFEKGADFGPPPGVAPRSVKKEDENGKEVWVKIPPPNMLFSSGCDKLGEVYGMATDPEIVERERDLTAEPPLFGFLIKVRLIHKATGAFMSAGLGYCSTWEKRYRWKQGGVLCPECGAATIRRSTFVPRGSPPDTQKGWWCAPREGGCNENFPYAHPALKDQKPGRTANDDTPSLVNTVLKMATIRAKRAAILAATRSAGLFTDVYDEDNDDDHQEPKDQKGADLKGGGDGNAEPERPERAHKIMLQGREHLTAGITEKTIVPLFQLNQKITKVTGDEMSAKKVIGQAFSRWHFIDLTEEQGTMAQLLLEAYLQRQEDAAKDRQ